MKSSKSHKEMADVFTKAAIFFKDINTSSGKQVINMGETNKPTFHDDDKHSCKTPACVGGWFVVMYNIEDIDCESYASFSDGADRFARDLGFNNSHELELFFYVHNELWGQGSARHMFCRDNAYAEGKITQLHISEKFFEVARNLKAAA